MKAKFLTAVLILGGLFATARESYGCYISPVAILTDYPDPVVDGCSVTLDGCSSYDPDGYITQWCFSWDWDSDPTWNYCSTTNCKTTHIYPGPGAYHARLRVKDNQGLYDYDYTWVHVGEPTLELRKGPYLIYDGNNTEMMVLWQLTGDANCTLAWGLDPNCDAGSVQTSEYGTDHQHKYIIPDVNTATKYYYRVEVPDDANYFGSFWTAPDANATGVKFLAYGDTRAEGGETDPVDHNKVCAQMINTYTGDPNYQTFTLHSGDWVWNGNTESYWADTHFNRSYPNLIEMQANLPIQGCTGNHEVDAGFAIAFEKYLPYPYEPDGRYWSFDYGPAHVVVVDQYNEGNEGVVDANQLEWIENDLAGTAKKWKFILLHEPGYSAGGGHDDNTDVQDNIQPLCESYGVDIVFAGHNHYYARCDVNGVKHITTGGGGAELRTPDGNYSEYVEECNSVHHFCKIAISDYQLNFEAVDVNGTVIDSFTLTHRWYVNSAVSGGNDDGTSWENAFTDLQDALADANDGYEIWVADGTYKPTDGNDRSISFELVDGVGVYGGFAGTEIGRHQRDWTAHTTILSGDIGTPNDVNDNSYHVVKGADEAVLDGFTITHGNADGSSPDDRGGGIYCNNTSPTISNCTIVNNDANGHGGGIYCYSASPTITNCVFSGNTTIWYGGGMFSHNQSSPTVVNCIFCDNQALGDAQWAGYGAGICNYDSSPTIISCVFNGNSAFAGGSSSLGGGIYNTNNSEPNIINCVFNLNSADYGGGGVGNYQSSPTLINCTFSRNHAGYGGGMYNEGSSSPMMTNCIFWGNGADFGGYEVYNYDYTSDPNFSYCDMKGVFNDPPEYGGYDSVDGGNNINSDPCFLDVNNPAGPDGIFRTFDDRLALCFGSPCIDAGNNGALQGTSVSTDIIGKARIVDGNHDLDCDIDMGAYELPRIWFVDKDATGSNDGTSWENAFTDLQDALADANDGDEAWVAKQTYKPTSGSNRSICFELVEGVGVYGGFAGTEVGRHQRDWTLYETILSGDIGTPGNQNDNSYHVVIGANNALLDGFTITKGYAHGGGGSVGGGLYNEHSNPTVANCIFSNNSAFVSGGAMYNYDSSPMISHCSFSNNSANRGIGMHNNWHSNPTIINCEFTENSGDGEYAGGMYNYFSSPILTNCIFSKNCVSAYGGAMWNYISSPTLTNCIFSKNSALHGGGIHNGGTLYNPSLPMLTNCTFSGNSATGGYGGGMLNNYSSPKLTNCTFSRNTASGVGGEGGGMFNNYSSPTVANCIFWADTPDEIYDSSSNPTVTYSDIEGGYAGTGNIDSDPCFVDANNPAGSDGIFYTLDDGLRLKPDSPCIDAADGNAAPDTDMCGDGPLDIEFVPNTGTGNPDYADIGAYEYINPPGYTTSFEQYQGYKYTTIDGNDGWKVEEGYDYICDAEYKYGDGYDDCHEYRYVEVSYNSTISYGTSDSCQKSFVHINCIPSPGSSIDIMNGSTQLASIKFGEDDDPNIYVWDNGSYEPVLTDPNYHEIAAKCRDFLQYPDTYYNDPNYSYENTWIEFMIQFDWASHTYDVNWTHYDAPDGELIYTGAVFHYSHRCYTKVEFKTGTDWNYDFYLNRMSISDTVLEGGVVGPDQDTWLIAPVADILNPLKGRCIVAGPMWYDTLGEYVIKCCPADLDPNDPNNWIQVCSGKSVSKEAITLGYWSTEGYYNGDYFLKIEVYDDLRQLHSEGIITAKRTFNGRSKICNVRYPIIGRLKARTFHYEEHPDFTINWPGTFPFEFKRMYNNGLRARIYPLFFGWTHNHNIRLIEDSSFDWIADVNEKPIGDADGLGVGRLWLCQPLGGAMFIGYVDTNDPNIVIYEPLDNENHYIIRTSSVDTSDPCNPEFDVTYEYHKPDGMKMTFHKVFTVPYPVPADEGLVDWMVVAGIDTREDRFGNALQYVWDVNEICLQEISNNRTPVKLVLRYEFAPGGPDGPQLCSSIMLYEGDTLVNDATVWLHGTSTQYGFIYSVEKEIIPPPQHPYEGYPVTIYYHGGVEQGFMLGEILYRWMKWPEPYEVINERCTLITNDGDGTLLERIDWCVVTDTWGGSSSTEEYDYEYDEEGNLVTTLQAKCGTDPPFGLYPAPLLREEVFVTSPQGALLKKNIRTFPVAYPGGWEFDPYDYKDYGSWCDALRDVRYHAGGGGAIDTEYSYEDEDFPLKPTTIIEYFDDDGDGQYDRPSRETRIEYDDRGNVLNHRVYVDSENFVYKEYDYHQDYDFPIREKTWQEHCYEEDGIVIKPGAGTRVEKQWFYSDDPDDAFDNEPRELTGDGSSGEYLVRERTLLGEAGGDQWAEIFYSYISGGRVKIKEDPAGSITYYEYDDEDEDDGYGFLEKEWQGATLNQQTGLPGGNPQKRYYYDGLGRKILEADYLGKVQMNVHDDAGRVIQAREYFDQTAITRVDFEPDSYDERPLIDDYQTPGYEDDWWQTRTLYERHDFWNKPWEVILPTGGTIGNRYIRCRNGIHRYKKVFEPGIGHMDTMLYVFNPHGRIVFEERYLRESSGSLQITGIPYVYDSMLRLVHKYSYFGYESPDVYEHIKHKEYQYDASGNKIFEVVYSVERGQDGFEPDSGVLEKSNSYEYDILGRLIKKIVDSTDGGLNQTTEYGYDAVGNRIYVIDPNGNVIFTDYDNANRKIFEYFATEPNYIPGTDEIDFAETKATAVVRKKVDYYKNNKTKDANSYDYDDSLLACTEYIYDSRGRIQQVQELIEDSDGNGRMDPTDDIATTDYYYSDDGSLEVAGESIYHTVIEDAEDKQTGIKLSYHGKPEIITYPSGDYEEYTYYSEPLNFGDPDPHPLWRNNGLLEKKAVWDGGTKEYITYRYDDYGKVEKKIYGEEDTDPRLEYAYTSRILGKYGKVKQITDYRNANDRPGAEGSTFTFDYWYLTGKVKTCTDYQEYKVHYDYLRAYDRPTKVRVEYPEGVDLYHVQYTYDLAGRLIDVREPLLGNDNLIADFDYDENGNREWLSYSLNGKDLTDPLVQAVSINYRYNRDNLLTRYTTTGGPTFEFGKYNELQELLEAVVDGLGRLKNADEKITDTSQVAITHSHSYGYDMRSQLTDATITNIGGSSWTAIYNYQKNEDMAYRTIQGSQTDFTYVGNLMDTASGGETFDLDWDLNGNMTTGVTTTLEYNWDNKLRSGTKGADSIALKYDPMGNRIFKDSSTSGQRKYIVDITGKLPVILMELDSADNMDIMKKYIYADGQVLAQHDIDDDALPAKDDMYFYLHDRLGSVRQMVDTSGDVVRLYTYKPFGETLEAEEKTGAPSNAFMFAGQYFDSEIDEYYLRARQYDPHIARFTTRDPVRGKFREPMTLHVYLYCLNDPVNRVDPTGELSFAELFTTQSIMKAVRGSMLGAAHGAYKWSRGGSWTDVVGGAAGGVVGGFGSAWFGSYGLIAKVAVATVSEITAHSTGHLERGEQQWFWEAGKREEFVAGILAGLAIENVIGRVDFDPTWLPGAQTIQTFRWEEARVFGGWIANLIWGEGSEYVFPED